MPNKKFIKYWFFESGGQVISLQDWSASQITELKNWHKFIKVAFSTLGLKIGCCHYPHLQSVACSSAIHISHYSIGGYNVNHTHTAYLSTSARNSKQQPSDVISGDFRSPACRTCLFQANAPATSIARSAGPHPPAGCGLVRVHIISRLRIPEALVDARALITNYSICKYWWAHRRGGGSGSKQTES